MTIAWDYFAAIVASTLRACSPVLLCSLAAALCSKTAIFNIAMEGNMLLSAFFAIVVNYYSGGNVILSVLAAVAVSVLSSALLAFFIIRLKASPVVAGMAINTGANGLTIFLMQIFFGTKGIFQDASLVGLHKVTPFFSDALPQLAKCFSGLTWIDYLSWVLAIAVYIFLYKTVIGYRLRAVGINQEAARSLGTKVESYQFWTMTLSGVFCGLAGVLLSMGSVTLFIQNISAGKGYIAMTANNLGASHPLGVFAASLFFGCCQALGTFLQNTALRNQITSSIPYVATLLALVIGAISTNLSKQRKLKKSLKENKSDHEA